MRVSTTIFGVDATTSATLAIAAEQAGFDAVWLTDHVLTPLSYDPAYPYAPSGRPGYPPTTPLPDALVLIGHIAARTTSIALGTGVLVMPLRHPLLLAQAVRTLVELTDDRLRLGVGTGWMREEFDVLGQQFEGRGARTDEMLDILMQALDGEVIEHTGEFYRIGQIRLGGVPLQPPQMIFGGTAAPALERAARRGDGWFAPPGLTVDEVVRLRADIEMRRRRAGRGELFRHYVRVPGLPDAQLLEQLATEGFDDIVVSLPRRQDGTVDPLEATDHFMAVSKRIRSIR